MTGRFMPPDACTSWGTTMAGIIRDEAVYNPERLCRRLRDEPVPACCSGASDPGSWGKEYARWLDNYDKMAGG